MYPVSLNGQIYINNTRQTMPVRSFAINPASTDRLSFSSNKPKTESRKDKFLQAIEKKFIFKPSKTKFEPIIPELKGKIESKFFQSFDGTKLNYWHVKGEEGKPTVFLLHGNTGNLTWHQHKMRMFAKNGYEIFALDYRGYGKSEGKPDANDTKKDVETFLKVVDKKHDKAAKDMNIFGHSLGGGFAIDIASKHDFKKVCVEGTFTSLKNMRATVIEDLCGNDHIGQVAKKILKTVPEVQVLNSKESVKKIKSPLLIIHSKKDETIPYEMAKELQKSQPNAKLMLINDGEHNTEGWQEPQILHFFNY